MGQFEHRRYKNNENNNKTSTWEYIICPFNSYLRGGHSVCKMAYMAIMDIRLTWIDHAQRKIKNGIRNDGLIDRNEGIASDIKNNITIEECFDFFEINYQHYSNNLQCFLDLSKVPDTPTALIATAFLVDFFQICGEQEV